MGGPDEASSSGRSRTAAKSVGPLKRVKQYGLLSLLGRGGMGEVYLAHDAKLDRRVAVKFLPDTLHEEPKARERFLREAKAAAALDHPFICKVIEAGESQGRSYIVMEYVEGRSLKDIVAEGPMPLVDAVRAVIEVAEALEAAHRKGIVHRDLKPANLMCTPQGHIKVMDFGLAKHVLTGQTGPLTGTVSRTMTADPGRQSITTPGVVVGTIAYMSPEQARGEPVDARTDIFSLGVVLMEMLSGKHPFDKPTPIETLTSVLRDSPPPVHVQPKALDPEIARILNKAMAKEAAARYPTIGEMAADLRGLLADVAPGARPGPWSRLGKAAAVAGAGAALVLAGLFLLRPRAGSGPPAGPEPIKVLIADFDNRTGDPVFDGALEQTFGIGLEGASFITLYDRARARDLSRQVSPDRAGRLDAQAAVLLSQREGINVVVSGTIEQAGGGGYAIRVEALDARNDKGLSKAVRTIATKAGVPAAAGELAAELRADLEGLPAGSVEALARETFTASSLEAMKAYQAAQDFANMGRDDDAIREYLRAVELDPKLGRAYAGLAVAHRNRGDLEASRAYYEKAMSLLDQMTEREKYRTRGGYYFVNRNFKQAIEEYRALREKFPADPAAYTNLSLAYFYARDMSKAYEEGRRAVEVSPGLVTPLYNLAWYGLSAGKLGEAEAAARGVVKLDASFAEAHVCLALVRLLEGRNSEAAAEYGAIEGLGAYAASLAASGKADLALYEGRLEDARTLLEAAAAADAGNDLKAMAALKRIGLAQTLLALGEKDAAVKAAEEAVAGSGNEGVQFWAGLLFAEAGRDDRARALAGALDKLLQPEPQACARIIEGELWMRSGRLPECVKSIHDALGAVDAWIGHLALGRAYLEAGQFTEAHSEFETCLARRGEAASLALDDLPTLRYLPPVYYYLGRAQEGLGIPSAKDSYKKFLEIKILAAGDPLVEDAKRRLAGL